MKYASDFKHGHGEAELRLVSIAKTKAQSAFTTALAYCLNCKSVFNYDENTFPEKCGFCNKHDYCLPDLIGTTVHHISAIFVNGPHHERDKRTLKDKEVYSRLKEQSVNVFIIKPEEIDAMTDASLVLWLEGTTRADPDGVYEGEKEYSCFR